MHKHHTHQKFSSFETNFQRRKPCYVCGSLYHFRAECPYYEQSNPLHTSKRLQMKAVNPFSSDKPNMVKRNGARVPLLDASARKIIEEHKLEDVPLPESKTLTFINRAVHAQFVKQNRTECISRLTPPSLLMSGILLEELIREKIATCVYQSQKPKDPQLLKKITRRSMQRTIYQKRKDKRLSFVVTPYVPEPPEIPLQCNICLKFYSTNYKLQVHYRDIHRLTQAPIIQATSTTTSATTTITNTTATTSNTANATTTTTTTISNTANATTTVTSDSNLALVSNPLQCNLCQKVLSSQYSLEVHFVRFHKMAPLDKRKYQCTSCDESYKSKKALDYHYRHTHRPPKIPKVIPVPREKRRHECVDCDECFTSRNLLDRHRRSSHPRRPKAAKVPLPTSVLPTSISMPTSPPFQCCLCHRVSSERVKLEKHYLKVHKISPYKCDVCGESFNTQGLLQKHMASHLPPVRVQKVKAKKFQCLICEEWFVSAGDRESHRRIAHTKNPVLLKNASSNPLQCNYCNRLSPNERNLERHLASIHDIFPKESKSTKNKSHKCDDCGESFKTAEFLSLHRRRRHERGSGSQKRILIPFPCQLCGRIFSKRFRVEAHLTLDHMIPPKEWRKNECVLCGLLFKDQNRLDLHHQAIHKEHEEEEEIKRRAVMQRQRQIEEDLLQMQRQKEEETVDDEEAPDSGGQKALQQLERNFGKEETILQSQQQEEEDLFMQMPEVEKPIDNREAPFNGKRAFQEREQNLLGCQEDQEEEQQQQQKQPQSLRRGPGRPRKRKLLQSQQQEEKDLQKQNKEINDSVSGKRAWQGTERDFSESEEEPRRRLRRRNTSLRSKRTKVQSEQELEQEHEKRRAIIPQDQQQEEKDLHVQIQTEEVNVDSQKTSFATSFSGERTLQGMETDFNLDGKEQEEDQQQSQRRPSGRPTLKRTRPKLLSHQPIEKGQETERDSPEHEKEQNEEHQQSPPRRRPGRPTLRRNRKKLQSHQPIEKVQETELDSPYYEKEHNEGEHQLQSPERPVSKRNRPKLQSHQQDVEEASHLPNFAEHEVQQNEEHQQAPRRRPGRPTLRRNRPKLQSQEPKEKDSDKQPFIDERAEKQLTDCDICLRSFISLNQLNQHRRVIHDIIADI